MADIRHVAEFTEQAEVPAYINLKQTAAEQYRLEVRSRNALFGKASYIDLSTKDLRDFLADVRYEGLGLVHPI